MDPKGLPVGESAKALTIEELGAVLQWLSEREAGILSMRYGFADGTPRSVAEIARIYGVSTGRIYQIESKTLEKGRRLLSQPPNPTPPPTTPTSESMPRITAADLRNELF
jgi:DNA-directed RNA polymerase sigma subunit (sigma70/sigma32)